MSIHQGSEYVRVVGAIHDGEIVIRSSLDIPFCAMSWNVWRYTGLLT